MPQSNYRDVPPHPAYADSALHTSLIRKDLLSKELWNGDVAKAVVVIDRVSQFEEAPIRFPLHKKVLEDMRGKAKSLLGLADKYEGWTGDLYHDD